VLHAEAYRLAPTVFWLDSGDTVLHAVCLVGMLCGLLIFLGTFAVGNNFDYRLVFTLLTLPQLFDWATEEQGEPRGRLAAITIVALLALLWIGALSEPLRLGDDVILIAPLAIPLVP